MASCILEHQSVDGCMYVFIECTTTMAVLLRSFKANTTGLGRGVYSRQRVQTKSTVSSGQTTPGGKGRSIQGGICYTQE